ncbi:MAG: CcdB family protein [Rhodobacteraceae bacterium]|nr:CcdB family protein [Paracoccaceae bacterium]
MQGFRLVVAQQADLLDNLNTRFVVPLIPISMAPPPATRLNPAFDIQSGCYVMVTQFLSSVQVSVLKAPVAIIVQHDTKVASALYIVLTGV